MEIFFLLGILLKSSEIKVFGVVSWFRVSSKKFGWCNSNHQYIEIYHQYIEISFGIFFAFKLKHNICITFCTFSMFTFQLERFLNLFPNLEILIFSCVAKFLEILDLVYSHQTLVEEELFFSFLVKRANSF